MLGLVDVGISLKRTNENDTRRTLEAVTRYSETPDSLVISLKEGRYENEGDPVEAMQKKRVETVRAMLMLGWATVADIMAKTVLTEYAVRRVLDDLGDGIEMEGTGKKGSPFRYRMKCVSFESSPIKDETNLQVDLVQSEESQD